MFPHVTFTDWCVTVHLKRKKIKHCTHHLRRELELKKAPDEDKNQQKVCNKMNGGFTIVALPLNTAETVYM